MTMTTVSTKPYLIRAIHEWCVDQGYTPYIAVVVDDNVLVPAGYARDGQIVLNLSPDATNMLVLGNDTITFQARFGGRPQSLSIPVGNVIAIYAAQTGQGMAFEPEIDQDEHVESADLDQDDAARDETLPDPDADPALPSGSRPRRGPPRGGHLKVVK